MTRSEAVEHLKNSTVKIDNASRVGTGFFIADKLIATCYHNIKGHSKDEFTVYWQGEDYAVESIEINEDDDLALLEIKIDKKHPILQIDKSIEVGDECQSFGYSKKNGDVITFEYEGKDGDGRLKFKEGLFQSGLSGGAILNFRTHKICGIVKRKRDNTESVALGGRGITISKLFGFEGLDMDENGSIFSKEMFKSWVWTSSIESADRLQFSVLALLETFVAVGGSFYLWFYYGFYWHIVTGLIVAPLFFLRTMKSELYALDFFKNKADMIFMQLPFFITVALIIIMLFFPEPIKKYQIEVDNSTINFLFMSFIVILIPIVITISIQQFFIFLLKIVSTIKELSFNSFKKTPYNWFRIILSTDIFHPPEILPGIEKYPNVYLKYSVEVQYIESKKDFFSILIVIILFIPTLLFRYSLKSTAWIYLPLIWLIQPQDKQNLTTRLKIESKNFIAYLMFFYSLVVVFVFTLLPLIFPHTPLGVYLQTLAIPPTLKTIFFAYEFNLWHLTRLLSALITIVFMFSFTKILIRRETEPSYGDFWGTKLLSLRGVRGVLTLVTLGFTAYHIFGLLPDGFFVGLWDRMKFLPEKIA